MIFIFLNFEFYASFSLSSFTFIKKFFSSSSLSAIRVVSSVYLSLLISSINLDSSLCFIQPSHDVLLSRFGPSQFLSGSNCRFLTCIQISQEAGKVVWYSHLLTNFPQFVVIHTVKGFSIVNEAEVDVFLEFSCFFYDPTDVCNLISGSSAFSKSSLNIWKFSVHVLLKPDLENFEHYFASM